MVTLEETPPPYRVRWKNKSNKWVSKGYYSRRAADQAYEHKQEKSVTKFKVVELYQIIKGKAVLLSRFKRIEAEDKLGS